MEQVKLMSWILFGFCCAKALPLLSKPNVDWVRHFAFRFLTPCLFFTSVYRADLNAMPSLNVYLAYGTCLISLFVALHIGLQLTSRDNESTVTIKALAALYPNAVGVGVPLIFALYGTQAELILMGVVVFNLVIVLPLVNGLMIFSGEPGFYHYRTVVTDPILLAIVAGLGLNLWGVELAPAFIEVLANIGWVALPVILFILGAGLSFYSLPQLLNEKVGLLLLVKAVGFPLWVWLTAQYAFALTTLETQVLVLLASLPTGINVYLLSERYQSAKEATASVIVFTTGFSLVSIWGWARVMQQWAT